MGCRSVLEFSQCVCMLFVITTRASAQDCLQVSAGTRYATELFWFILNVQNVSSLKHLCDYYGLYHKTIKSEWVCGVCKCSFILLLLLLMWSFLLRTGRGRMFTNSVKDSCFCFYCVGTLWGLQLRLNFCKIHTSITETLLTLKDDRTLIWLELS